MQNQKPQAKKLAAHLDKDDDGQISAGDILSFEVILLNDGDITHSGVVRTIRFLHPLRPARLAATARSKGTYKVTQADVDAGSFVNKVEATMKRCLRVARRQHHSPETRYGAG